MARIHCIFNHANPAGARFCNECGCILQPEPSVNREAVEHRGVGNHLDRGTGFPDSTTLADAAGIAGATADNTASGPSAGAGSQSVTADLASFQRGLADDSSQFSAVRINPRWCDSWIAESVVRSPVLDRSGVRDTVGAEDDAQHRDNGVILGRGSVWKPNRGQILATAVLVALFVSVLYGYQETRRMAAPIDKQSPASTETEPSGIPLHREAATDQQSQGSIASERAGPGSLHREAASKPVSLAPNEHGERAREAGDGAAAVDVGKTVEVPAVRHAEKEEFALRGAEPLASDVPAATTAEVPTSTSRAIVRPVRKAASNAAQSPKSGASIDSERTTMKMDASRERFPSQLRANAPSAEQPPNPAPTSPCSDQVVALGLCATSGVSGRR